MKKMAGLLLSSTLLLPFAVPAYAATPVASVASVTDTSWTYEKAVARALELSKTIKNAQADVDRSLEVLSSAGDNVKFFPGGPGNPEVDKAFTSYIQADNQRTLTRNSLEKEKDKTELTVRKAYNAVVLAEAKVKLNELAVKNAETQQMVMQYKYQFGAASALQQKQLDTDYAKERKVQEADKIALTGAYQTFNQLIGLKPQDRPVLREKPEFKKLENVDLESHISGVISISPDIASLNKMIDVAQTNLKLYHFNVPGSEPYTAKQIDVTKQETSYSNAKDEMGKALRSMYATILQIEEQYDGVQAKLPYAEDAARLAKLQFDVGVGTKADMQAADLAVEQLKQQLFDLAVKHDDLVNTFKKPWAGQ